MLLKCLDSVLKTAWWYSFEKHGHRRSNSAIEILDVVHSWLEDIKILVGNLAGTIKKFLAESCLLGYLKLSWITWHEVEHVCLMVLDKNAVGSAKLFISWYCYLYFCDGLCRSSWELEDAFGKALLRCFPLSTVTRSRKSTWVKKRFCAANQSFQASNFLDGRVGHGCSLPHKNICRLSEIVVRSWLPLKRFRSAARRR